LRLRRALHPLDLLAPRRVDLQRPFRGNTSGLPLHTGVVAHCLGEVAVGALLSLSKQLFFHIL